ncbi:putative Methyltransferase, FkbM family [Candidatus Sulfotelmatomonas gaucii]|uniref:Putative Methyltransferase, FkbM family n=1 Tax=Candidatus Sulfuritelmatomonas gaucii TaxID=2043161 RepID=A0A2N9MA20_9BACT|nr:putative Methyltransferase, FkbM family [Candidatus Sulfotelmatomonas gaucii]
MNSAFIKEVGPIRWAHRTAVRQFFKRIARRDQRMKLPTGEWITLPISDHFASEVYITRADVDWGSERLLDSFLRRSGVFLDVGAHIGYYGLYVLPHVKAVYSFEPDPRVRVFLEKNLSGRPAIEIVPCAVGSTEGKAPFTLERHSEISHLSGREDQAGSQIEVDVVTIDAFVARRSLTVEAIKIDVEGHDAEVIAGSLEVLAQHKPLVLTESKPDAVLFDMMRRVAYRVFAFVRNSRTRERKFVELRSPGAAMGETKMLFLVPDRLAGQFEQVAGEWGIR